MVTLARFVFPTAALCSDADLYARAVRDAKVAVDSHEVRLGPAGLAQFNTYFNAFPVAKWLRHTTVRDVTVAVEVTGAIRAEVLHEDLDGRARIVVSEDMKATTATWFSMSLPPIDQLGNGSAFLRVNAFGDGAVIHGAEWRTESEAESPARVGLVITTYGHEDQVKENVARLVAAADAAGCGDRVDVVVVNNMGGDDLEVPTATVLANRNLGGAGGFTRGLMHLRDAGSVTHVLFMDDDVWFEPDVVLRALEMLSYRREPQLCLAGAMLPDNRPTTQFEAGAKFNPAAVYPNRPLGTELDVAQWREVLECDLENEPIDYGAWWFFAFPLDLTRDNPIPAFVRGDDVSWGLLHAGSHTVAMSGLAVWHMDFETKNSPTSWFYDTRNYALVSVLSYPKYNRRQLLWRYWNVCGRSMLALKYSSADLITFGLQEFLRGPEHWMQLDQPALHQHVRSRDEERVGELDPELASVPDLPVPRGAGKAWLAARSLATLGGHVFPDRWQNKPVGAIRVQQRALSMAPGRREILYRDGSGQYGFVARRNQRRFFSLLRDMGRTTGTVVRHFPAVARAYREAYPQMVSDGYWRDQFAIAAGSSS